eukprot:3336976-Rhodomonas_salina.2
MTAPRPRPPTPSLFLSHAANFNACPPPPVLRARAVGSERVCVGACMCVEQTVGQADVARCGVWVCVGGSGGEDSGLSS